MGRTIEAITLRFLQAGEASLFSAWEAQERPYPWSERVFPKDTLVFENDGQVIGFAVVRVVGEEAYLSNFMVASETRRRGWGEKILQKVMMWAGSQGARVLLLDVDIQNLPAINLYKKLGFEILQRREKSYPRGEAAFVMRRAI
ncbi:MAG: hypothetical protein KCHDKBKB_02125 [Elusimicrobia bacterium]|nr:hypothetical protein [Elusimicrobiota bacterium]